MVLLSRVSFLMERTSPVRFVVFKTPQKSKCAHSHIFQRETMKKRMEQRISASNKLIETYANLSQRTLPPSACAFHSQIPCPFIPEKEGEAENGDSSWNVCAWTVGRGLACGVGCTEDGKRSTMMSPMLSYTMICVLRDEGVDVLTSSGEADAATVEYCE